jgi:integrase
VEVTPQKRSAEREKSRINLLKQHFGHYMVSSLQSKHVAQFRDFRINQGKAGATVLKEINTLSHVIDTAIKDWGLPLVSNPVKLVRKPKEARGRSRRLSRKEEELLLASCRQSKAKMLESIVLFAIETGMRLSEMLNLEWKDVNMQTRVAILHQTKNGEVRLVPLSSKAICILEILPRHISDSRVFWEWKGTDSLEHTWRRCVDKSGIIDFRFHDLRHEATSRFFENGMNMMEVAAITGHKTLQMLKRYTHLKAEDLVKKLG